MNKRYIQKAVALLCALVGILIANVAPADAKINMEEVKAFNDSCLRCHGAAGLNMVYEGKKLSLYVSDKDYYASMHAYNKCTTCHTDIGNDYPHVGAKKGKELRKLVDSNCQRCHQIESKIYKNSVHGQLQKAGKETAFCTDCHGKHNIMKKENPTAADFKQNIPATCMECHKGVVEKSYHESFHGKAIMLGSKKSATCADCHGDHEILPKEDLASKVNKANIPETCANCHKNPEPNFAKGSEHYELAPEGPGMPVFWTLIFFVWLTVCTLVTLFLHIQMELWRKLKDADRPSQH